MIRLALLGSPVAHSRSPLMMRAAFQELGVAGEYVAFDVPPERLAGAVEGLWALGFDGANITLPHKSAVIAHLARTQEAARVVGAVNTLVRLERGFEGRNTDVEGIVDTLRARGVALQGARVVLLGAGGAARAAAVALSLAGAERIDVVARRFEGATSVLECIERSHQATLGRAQVFGAKPTQEALAEATLVLQATSCGMEGAPSSEVVVAGADLSCCARDTVAFDLVYAPAVTPWMLAAERLGLRVLPGAGGEMLARQGAASLGVWLRGEAPLEAMRHALGV